MKGKFKRLNLVLLIGILLRFTVFFFRKLHGIAYDSVEITSPLSSKKSLEEGFFFLKNGIEMYDGGVNHHAPILVIVMFFLKEVWLKIFYWSKLEKEHLVEIFFTVFLTLIDVHITKRIVSISNWYSNNRKKKFFTINDRFDDYVIAGFYMLNPLMIFTTLSHSTVNIFLLFLVESMYQLSVKRRIFRGMLFFATLTYFSVLFGHLFIPLIALTISNVPEIKPMGVIVQGLISFCFVYSTLTALSYAFLGSWIYLKQCILTEIGFKIMQPNIGLWWYFFIEIFDYFRTFFIYGFNFFLFIFILPLTLRFFEFKISDKKYVGDSFFAFYLCYLWLSFMKPYPVVADIGFGISLLPIFKNILLSFKKKFILIGFILYISLLLSPIFYYTWIYLENTNSNFFYSISLILGVVYCLFFINLIWMKLIFNYYEENNLVYDVKNPIRLIQI